MTNEPMEGCDTIELLILAADQGVFLFCEEGQLRFKLSVSEFPARIKAQILENKQQLIDFLTRRGGAHLTDSIEKITAVKDQHQPFSMSYAQQRLWFIDQYQGNSSLYNMAVALDVTGPVKLDVVEEVMEYIVTRHTPLRTCYKQSSQGGVQYLQEENSLALQTFDISHFDSQRQQQEIERLVYSEQQKPFDLSHDLMLRVCFIVCGDKRGVMLINMHHIASDGWSMEVLTQEFINCYQSRIQGQPFSLEPLDISYLDYADWQKSDSHRQALERQLDFWQQNLANAPEHHSLPLDHSRPKNQSMSGAVYQTQLAIDLSNELTQLAKAQNTSVFVLLHAALSLLIYRYSGSSDILIGTPVANRLNPQLAPLIGLFVNTVILRTDCSENIPFKNYLEQVKAVNVDALDNQQAPFELVVDRLNPQRNLSYSPLFQIMLTMDFDALQDIQFGDIKFSTRHCEQITAKFDLTLHVTTTDSGLVLSFEYCTALFEAHSIELFAQHLQQLLSSIVKTPDSLMNDLAMISDSEREQLIDDIKPREVDRIPRGHLLQLFDSQVAAMPDKVALSYERAQLTYSQLDVKANQLAHLLIAQGVKRDTLVGLSVSRSLNMLVGMLAILKAGGAYVPLDPAYPEERLSYMIENSGLTLLLTSSEIDSFEVPAQVNRIDMDTWNITSGPMQKPDVEIVPSQLAYVIYTSGSTGQPKGVMVEHASIFRLFATCQDDFHFGSEDVWCLFHSYAFDFSVWEIWGALAYGGRLVVVPQWVSRASEDFYQLVCDEKITILNQTPTAFNQFKKVDARQCQRLALRAIVFGGEALNLNELADWLTRHNDSEVMLVNMYGITETTVHVTYRRLFKRDIEANQGCLIGRALADLSVYLLDLGLQPVPTGIVGEMYVGGKGVTRGYLHQPQLTSERFIDNPYCPGERLYRTGDSARYLKSGELEYVGRVDEQVKIRGFRIELGEIEQQISAQSQIDSCVVVVNENTDKHKQLVAYILAAVTYVKSRADDEVQNKSAEGRFISKCRSQLRAVLPSHMIPAVFVVIDRWPLTANGKVNKKLLPVPEVTVLQENYVPPQNDMQQLLCEIWAMVLGVERIGIEDNFFNIGGDSILSIQIVSELKKRGYALAVKHLFEHQCIAELAGEIIEVQTQTQQDTAPFSQLSEFEKILLVEQHGKDYPAVIADAYPLSSLQAGMVFHTQLAGFNGIYHDIMAEHIKCPWDQPIFAQALEACIQKHPILRTTFIMSADRPLQQVYQYYPAPLEVIDIRDMSSDVQSGLLANWTESRKTHVFQWSEGPLYQIHIFLRSDESFEFVMSFHHAILDGWSRAAFSTELYGQYRQLLNGEKPNVRPPQWIYRDFIVLEQQSIQDQNIAQHFKEMLAQAPLQQVPYKMGHDTQAPRRQQNCVVDEVKPLSADLLALAKKLAVPIQYLLLTVHFKVLSLLSGESHVVSCVTHNGRPETEGADRGLGLFLNSLPLSMPVEPMRWCDLIALVSKLGAQNMACRRFPIAEIQKHLGREFSEVTFNYTHFHIYDSLSQNSDNGFELLDSNAFEQTNFDFHVDIARSWLDDKFNMVIHFNAHLFDMAQIEQIKEYYLRAFKQLLADPNAGHCKSSLMSSAQLQQLQNWSTHDGELKTQTLIEQFMVQVEKKPDALALVSADTRLTYSELYRVAERLAGYLQQMDIVEGSRVGLYLPRGIAQLVGVLGVSMAGAAFVPLEPSLPPNRLAYMIKDANIELLLLPSSLMDTLSLSGVDVLLMDQILSEQWLDEFAGSYEYQSHNGCAPAYAIYTSGSTGRPKGVQISHASLAHYLAHAKRNYLAEHIMGSVVSSPLCFDATLTTLLTPLCVGKQVQLLADGDAAMAQLPGYLFHSESNWLFKLTPAHLDALSDSYDDAKSANRESARHIIVVGGEQLRVATLKRYKGKLLPQSCFINEYGPTETVVGTSTHTVNSAEDLALLAGQTNVPIGKPITGSCLFVVGANDQLQPPNSTGQLYIGGAGVALDYINRAEQTAEQFAQFNGLRVYKTGDLVRWLPCGLLAFVGRADEQVKIHGYRIEPTEISEQLLGLPNISEAQVVARPNELGDFQLVAYLVAHQQAHNDIVDVCRNHLGANLPEYMIPAHFVLVEGMPLTINGKLDIAALPAPVSQALKEGSYVVARTELEHQICQVWERVMKQGRVGVEDNFFALGGDSIRSIRVVSLLKREGIYIDIKDIFANQNVARLAQYVEEQGDSRTVRQAVVPFSLLTEQERQHIAQLDVGPIVDAYPLSTLQTGMVYHTQLENFSGIYHDINAEHIKFRWKRDHFETALRACIEAHPVLRTGYDLSSERPLQLVYQSIDLPLVVEDIRDMTPKQQRQHLSDWIDGYKHHVFGWLNGPLYQINIFLRDEDSIEFVFSFHHAVLDGWSRAAFSTELYNNYYQLLAGDSLGDIRQLWLYREYISLELETLKMPEAKAYFSEMVEHAPAKKLLGTVDSNSTLTGQAYYPIEGFSSRSNGLIELADRLGQPLQAVLMAVHFKFLATLSGENKVMSCVVSNGRPELEDGESALGLYLNSLPLVIDIPRGSWRDLISNIAAANTATMAYRHYPLAKIQQDCGLTFSEVLFNYTHFHIFQNLAGDDSPQSLEMLGTTGFEQTNFDFLTDVQRSIDGDSLSLNLVYNQALFSESQIRVFEQYFMTAVDAMLKDVDSDVRQLVLLDETEIDQQMRLFQCTDTMAVPWQSIHQGFEAQVLAQPHQLAAQDAGQKLSYEQLNRQANRLAWYLREQSITVGNFIGISVDCSVDMMVCVLAVLKSGCAYVPLDSNYPQQRLNYLYQDSGIKYCLSHSSQQLPDAIAAIRIDVDTLDIGGYYDCDPGVGLVENQLAYMIYTSGSTGAPKGVKVPHSGVVNYLEHVGQHYLEAHHHGAVVSSPLSFDATVTSLLAPLWQGKTVVLLAQQQQALVDGLLQYLLNSEQNWLFKMTPAHLEFLLPLCQAQQVDNRHTLVLGGEQLLLCTVTDWQQQVLPMATFINEYGPTETVVGCSFHQIKPGEQDSEVAQEPGQTAVSVGRTIGNSQVYIFNEDLQFVPQGTIGQLYIGGVGVTQGYHNRADLTDSHFIASELSPVTGLYRTGDLVRYLPDGQLMFVGRQDIQVKIRGFRIELGEIAAQVRALDCVNEAVVLLDEQSCELVVYVVAQQVHTTEEQATQALIDDIKTHLRERLPAHMLPAHYLLLDVMPLTNNGKIDNKALSALEVTPVQQALFVQASSELETAVSDIWQNVLSQKQISVEANFFDIGGHSLFATRLLSLLQAYLADSGIEVTLSMVFEYPSIALFSQYIEQQRLLQQMNSNKSLYEQQETEDFEEEYL